MTRTTIIQGGFIVLVEKMTGTNTIQMVQIQGTKR